LKAVVLSHPIDIVKPMEHNPAHGADQLIAGERVHALVAALVQLKTQPARNDRLNLTLDLDGPAGAPLVRALMRIEAELLLADTDDIAPLGGPPFRTPEQRRADALVALVCRVDDALRP
jgi:hypothetical protein